MQSIGSSVRHSLCTKTRAIDTDTPRTARVYIIYIYTVCHVFKDRLSTFLPSGMVLGAYEKSKAVHGLPNRSGRFSRCQT